MTTESWRGQTVDKVEDLPIDESVSRRREARALLGSLLKPYRFAVLLLGLVVAPTIPPPTTRFAQPSTSPPPSSSTTCRSGWTPASASRG